MFKFISIAFAVLMVSAFFSCSSSPEPEPEPEFRPEPEVEVNVKPEPDILEPPELIMGKGIISAGNMSRFLVKNNTALDEDFARRLAAMYMHEAAIEGVNHDIAFAQMCLETGFLRYDGLVKPEWNNFCGLGSIGPEQPGLKFPNTRIGVRAHVQHLKAYATENQLNGIMVDPRYKYVRKGSSPDIHGLSGTWAADKSYSVKISDILQRLYKYSF